jgi:hypothetical protein
MSKSEYVGMNLVVVCFLFWSFAFGIQYGREDPPVQQTEKTSQPHYEVEEWIAPYGQVKAGWHDGEKHADYQPMTKVQCDDTGHCLSVCLANISCFGGGMQVYRFAAEVGPFRKKGTMMTPQIKEKLQ